MNLHDEVSVTTNVFKKKQYNVTGCQFTEKGQRDFELIDRILSNRDRNAYDNLFGNYRNSVYCMMLKMTQDPKDAEFLTIEAFHRASKMLRQYTPKFSFSTWLFRIACNNCIDFMHDKSKGIPGIIHKNKKTD